MTQGATDRRAIRTDDAQVLERVPLLGEGRQLAADLRVHELQVAQLAQVAQVGKGGQRQAVQRQIQRDELGQVRQERARQHARQAVGAQNQRDHLAGDFVATHAEPVADWLARAPMRCIQPARAARGTVQRTEAVSGQRAMSATSATAIQRVRILHCASARADNVKAAAQRTMAIQLMQETVQTSLDSHPPTK